jgi:hypothetical protein
MRWRKTEPRSRPMVARLQPLGGVPKNGALNEMQRGPDEGIAVRDRAQALRLRCAVRLEPLDRGLRRPDDSVAVGRLRRLGREHTRATIVGADPVRRRADVHRPRVNDVPIERGSSSWMSLAARPDSEIWMMPPPLRSPPDALTTTERAMSAADRMGSPSGTGTRRVSPDASPIRAGPGCVRSWLSEELGPDLVSQRNAAQSARYQA